jgi:hypothetical protein
MILAERPLSTDPPQTPEGTMVTFARDDQSHDDADASTDDQIRHLQRALRSQPVIEQAKGLLMAQHGCTPDEAFAMLMRASQRENRKLRDIARAMIHGSAHGAVDQRVLAADARDRAADARDRAADERDTVVARERADVDAVMARAVLRDRSAEQRDRRADQRDLVSQRFLAGSEAEHIGAASDRGQSALDRYQSGVDRDLSAGDRADLQASRQHRP